VFQRPKRIFAAGFLIFDCLLLASNLHGATNQIQQQPDGIILRLPTYQLRIQVISDSAIRIAAARDASFFSRSSIDVLPHTAMTRGWKSASTATSIMISTAKLRIHIDRGTGVVKFLDASGNEILSESESSRIIEPASVQGENTFHVAQRWNSNPDESLYGLGQQQLGIVDIEGYDLDLWQHNTNVVVPFLVSSKGYGIFWDNTSYTRFGDLRQFETIPAANLLDSQGQPGGLSVQPMDGSSAASKSADLTLNVGFSRGGPRPKNMRWEGFIKAPVSGEYQFQTYSNGGIKVWLDNKLMISHWRQGWLTSNDQVKVQLEAGHRYPGKIETDSEQQSTLQFLWKTPASNHDTSLWSEVGDGEDYYFVYGPKLDDVVAGYRLLTGRANMMPSWAFGLWQSKQRYETAQQSVDVVNEFRRRNIPFDNIVQDWQYWRPDSWGSHEFDPTRFPDPDGWIKTLHDLHAHLMISVWGKFNPNTENAKLMQAKGFLYQPDVIENQKDWIGFPYTFYDAFNPDARKLFWSQVNTRLFSKGVDAWWMDATEPDLTASPPTLEGNRTHMNPTAMGTGSRMLNGYALMNSNGVYTGQREAAPNQRVFILTRSGFAGQQRYSAATWSGDITSTWTAMAKQISAGLGMSISGVPYWTMDAGGYTMQRKFVPQGPATVAPKAEDEEEWRELNARWFEFATFCPLLRVHGELRPREMWALGDDSPAYQAELKFDRLRYEMFPYNYSVAGAVTQHDSTIMRPLVMDFPHDAHARELTDEYMFGPAFLVAPITHYQERSREVYLPDGAKWYDFWTGNSVPSGTATNAPAPYDAIPIFVRSGSIVPFGPDVQYIAEKPSDPTTLFVYTGADGTFTLYEDQGVTFDYEHGAFTETPITWQDATRTLIIGKQQGSFPGMLTHRTFHIVVVSKEQPIGFSQTAKPLRTVQYDGAQMSVKLP
jgi:alpha-D-xyloside xylohydrolase